MMIVNSYFQIRPNLLLEDTHKVMFIALCLNDDAMDVFYKALEEDPDIIIRYIDLLAKTTADFTPVGTRIQAYLLLLRLVQEKDSMEIYIKRFQNLVDAADIPYRFASVHFRNGLNSHHANLVRHHRCDIYKDDLLAINRGMGFLVSQKASPSYRRNPDTEATSRNRLQKGISPEEYQCHMKNVLCFL